LNQTVQSLLQADNNVEIVAGNGGVTKMTATDNPGEHTVNRGNHLVAFWRQ
jgi:hypothetical protein